MRARRGGRRWNLVTVVDRGGTHLSSNEWSIGFSAVSEQFAPSRFRKHPPQEWIRSLAQHRHLSQVNAYAAGVFKALARLGVIDRSGLEPHQLHLSRRHDVFCQWRC
jgi:hypothetical protein